MPEVTIRLPMQFRGFVGGAESVRVEADTVKAALAALSARSSALGERLLAADGSLRRFVNIYRGDEDIRRLQGLETALETGSILLILVAMAGG